MVKVLRFCVAGAWPAVATVACTITTGGGPDSGGSPDGGQVTRNSSDTDTGNSTDGPPAVDASGEAGASCIGNVADALASSNLAPSFLPIGILPNTPGSTSCRTVSASGGTLTLTKSATCAGQPNAVANYVALDSNRFVLCGDFDVQVDFDLTTFPVPTANRWAGLWISTADILCWSTGLCPGISLERYGNGSRTPTEYYKIWGTNPSLGAAKLVATTDTTGQLRITRKGALC